MLQRMAVTTERSPVLRARPPPLGLLLAAALFVLGVLISPSSTPAAAQTDDGTFDGTNYYYSIFVNNLANVDSVDGPSGVGTYGTVGYGGALVEGSVVFSDMGGSGSAIRAISRDGRLSTIAGSLVEKGCKDGSATEARFGGVPKGNTRVNPVVHTKEGYYVADTVNNALRLIHPTTGRTTTIVGPTNLRYPTSLAIPADKQSSIFISNTGKNQVLYYPDLTSPVGQVTFPNESDFTPGAITVFPELSRTFIVNSYLQIYCWHYRQPNTASWKVSEPRTADFGRMLSTSSDGTKLLYVNFQGHKILSLDAKASQQTSPALKPELVIELNLNIIGGAVRLFFERSKDSWYILTDTRLLIVSKTPIQPEESSSSSSSSESPTEGRHESIAAFPADAFPTDRCRMTQVYSRIRMDAEKAFGTNDYVNEFVESPGDVSTYVKGSVNVSTWCSKITTLYSNDRTIVILPFWAPKNMGQREAHNRLKNSPWSHTRSYLNLLRSEGMMLGSFCFIDCRDTCKIITAPKCPADPTESRCDDVCKGAVATAVVLGAAGIVLLALMIASPLNIFRAFVMVPVI
ncbi:hypothetical protein JKF63_07626 [Porcisia hertigi]|uniref:Uncharacterized protein n=1 Tax=Porcisia hertigi TaxID=2761500 RepID=A0A836IZT2_9TRYP|nr:hypothetical protein JKF63_07626 [Porcisia hertigi]